MKRSRQLKRMLRCLPARLRTDSGSLAAENANGCSECLAGERPLHELADIRQQDSRPGKAQSVGRQSRRFVG